MVNLKNIVLNTRTEELEKLISPMIEEQFPNFVRSDYRKLVLFIKSYYEWLEKKGNPGYVISNLDSVYDVDKSLEEYYSHFKSTYLEGFPEELATNTTGNKPNKNTLIKHIRDFYGNKGTESAYKFLFRVLYDSEVEFYYPKEDILKTSDGRWFEQISIKSTSGNGSALFSAEGKTIYQYRGSELIASAVVDRVVQYTQDGYEVTEYFLNNLIGNFDTRYQIKFTVNDVEYIESLYSVLGEFYIETPGKNFKIGDTAYITDDVGRGFAAFIESVGIGGSIKKIAVKNSGINYFNTVTISFISDTGKKESAKVFANPTAITRYPGFYTNNSGKLSSTKKIQDGHYYQDFSYELKAAVSLDTYYEILKDLVHPAGTKMFGSILVKEAIDNTETTSAQATTFKVPLIGRYTPYALRTHNNLRNGYFLPNQVRGATLQVWLSSYNIAGNTSDGITAGWGSVVRTATIGDNPGGRAVTTEDIWGINRWVSLVGGHTFAHNPAFPNNNVWLTPNVKKEAINTHPSVNFRPIQYNFTGPSTYSRLVSCGFSGPTMGALGLTLSTSYFAVAKPRRISNIGSFGSHQTTGVLLGDRDAYRGIVFGVTGSGSELKIPKIAAFSYRTSSNVSSIVGSIGTTGDWKLISHTLTCSSGNSGPMSLFVNGVCLGTVAQAWTPAAGNQSWGFQIGQQREDSLNGVFDGEIAEILAYQGDVGETDRQKVEGYLAHKYGLAANLPSTHPYKTSPPGASFNGGNWLGAIGDFYPYGYNPYIGSTTEVGIDGKTASLGSLFYASGMGYTYTVMDEYGITAHSPIGSPLGSTAAWYANKESSVVTPDQINGLVLWLKPENIGVCGSVANGATVDVWLDASSYQNHAVPPTWDKWNGVAHITQTSRSGPASDWAAEARSTNAVTKISFVGSGLCGGFTTGRLFMMGLNTDPSTNATYTSIDYAWYIFGPYERAIDSPRNAIVYESGVNLGSFGTHTDNTVFSLEYQEPNIIYSMDGLVKRSVYAGYGLTFYIDSSFYGYDPVGYGNRGVTGTSVTLLESSFEGNSIVPNWSVTSSRISAVNYAGVTIDKLRPTLQTGSANGATGVSFNGGVLFAPATTAGTTALSAVIGMGLTSSGSTSEKLLTSSHLYFKKPITLKDDADIFVVFKPTSEGYGTGYGLLGSRSNNMGSLNGDSVLFSRSYNSIDLSAANQTSLYYTILPNGKFLYQSSFPTGLFGFRPSGDQTGTQQGFIVYDPHVSGVCMGQVSPIIGEAIRGKDKKIDVLVNGDYGTNHSPSTGRGVALLSTPANSSYLINNGLLFGFNASILNTTSVFRNAVSKNLLSSAVLRETPLSILYPNQIWGGDGSGASSRNVTGISDMPTFGSEEVYEITLGTSNNAYLNNGTGGNARWNGTASGIKSTAWTFTAWIRREDGAAINSASVYIYAFGNDTAAGTIQNAGSGWYKITRTKTGSSGEVPTLVGFSNLSPGVKYYIAGAQLLPYNEGDTNGTVTRTRTSYPSWVSVMVGSNSNNSIVSASNPWSDNEFVWNITNHNTISTGNGGFDTFKYEIDRTKLYRFSIWMNRKVLGSNGRSYLGTHGYDSSDTNTGLLRKSSGDVDTNPYFAYPSPSNTALTGKQNQWILVVGHIHPTGTATGDDHPNSGFYLRTGAGATYASLRDGSQGLGDYVFKTDTQKVSLRAYLYYSSDNTVVQQFMRPRIDLVDGTEPSISDLLNNADKTIYDSTTNGKNMYVINSPSWSSDSGGVMEFSGKGDTIRTIGELDITDANNMTWEAWVNHDGDEIDTDIGKMFMGMGGRPYFAASQNGRLCVSFHIGSQIDYNTAVGSFVKGRWNHFAATVESDSGKINLKLYINGVLNYQNSYFGNNLLGSKVLSLGQRGLSSYGTVVSKFPTGGDYDFKGKISNARVYNRALSVEEIAQNYNSIRTTFGL